MTGLLATRTARRRAIAYSLLLAATLALMAFSGSRPVVEFQTGVGFAFRPIQGALDGAARTVASTLEALGDINRLRADNQAFREENERLRIENAQLDAIRRENEQLTALLQLASGLEYDTIAARVIGRESSEFRRVVTLDRGSDEGIEKGDVVIAAGGALAGRVVEVGPTFSRVLLINDTSSTVIGQVPGSGATGEVIGQLEGALVMRNIDATEQVQLGEEVVTAGIELSGGVRSPYPRGLLIGQVVDVRRDVNDVVQTAFLAPTANLDKLEVVLVITSYAGGLPPAEQQPIPCEPTDGGTLPEGEQPCYTPTPAPTRAPGFTPTPRP
jgi:rod shape-determining protein MreC